MKTFWSRLLGATLLALAVTFAFRHADAAVEVWKTRRANLYHQIDSLTAANHQIVVDAEAEILAVQARQPARIKHDTVVVERVKQLAAQNIPLDCDSFVAQRDTLIRDLIVEKAGAQADLTSMLNAANGLLGQLETTTFLLEEAKAVVKDAPIEKSFWGKLKPELRVGPGFSATYALDDQRIHVGPSISVSLSWSF